MVGDKSGLVDGCTSGESIDRADLGLPGVQQALVEAIVATGRPVVVVLINGRPLALPWIAEHVAAMVEAWLPGEEGGTAVADVLFGDYNPGGKLPISLPVTVGQVPVYYNHKPSGGRSNWKGDYLGVSSQPLFPFGHGLSFTRFEFHDLVITPPQVSPAGTVRVQVGVTNVGERAGDEVVQTVRPRRCGERDPAGEGAERLQTDRFGCGRIGDRRLRSLRERPRVLRSIHGQSCGAGRDRGAGREFLRGHTSLGHV